MAEEYNVPIGWEEVGGTGGGGEQLGLERKIPGVGRFKIEQAGIQELSDEFVELVFIRSLDPKSGTLLGYFPHEEGAVKFAEFTELIEKFGRNLF